MRNPHSEQSIVEIVVARCERTRAAFGIRMEERGPSIWVATWAFPLGEASAKREGYTDTEIKGSISFAETFPGCPYCCTQSFFVCGCNEDRVTCWDREKQDVICAWCTRCDRIDGLANRMRGRSDV